MCLISRQMESTCVAPTSRSSRFLKQHQSNARHFGVSGGTRHNDTSIELQHTRCHCGQNIVYTPALIRRKHIECDRRNMSKISHMLTTNMPSEWHAPRRYRSGLSTDTIGPLGSMLASISAVRASPDEYDTSTCENNTTPAWV